MTTYLGFSAVRTRALSAAISATPDFRKQSNTNAQELFRRRAIGLGHVLFPQTIKPNQTPPLPDLRRFRAIQESSNLNTDAEIATILTTNGVGVHTWQLGRDFGIRVQNGRVLNGF